MHVTVIGSFQIKLVSSRWLARQALCPPSYRSSPGAPILSSHSCSQPTENPSTVQGSAHLPPRLESFAGSPSRRSEYLKPSSSSRSILRDHRLCASQTSMHMSMTWAAFKMWPWLTRSGLGLPSSQALSCSVTHFVL